jgi:replicative superfamily II helicase
VVPVLEARSSCLVFCQSRRKCEETAVYLIRALTTALGPPPPDHIADRRLLLEGQARRLALYFFV